MTTPVTDDDLRNAAESLAQTEDLWTKISALSSQATMVCPECSGTGTLAGGGIFGEIECPTCEGAREVDHPAAAELGALAMPDFAGLRRQLRDMTSAHDEAARKAYLTGGAFESPVTPAKVAAFTDQVAKVREEGRQMAVAMTKHTLAGESGRDRRRAFQRPVQSYGSLGSGGDTVGIDELEDADAGGKDGKP